MHRPQRSSLLDTTVTACSTGLGTTGKGLQVQAPVYTAITSARSAVLLNRALTVPQRTPCTGATRHWVSMEEIAGGSALQSPRRFGARVPTGIVLACPACSNASLVFGCADAINGEVPD